MLAITPKWNQDLWSAKVPIQDLRPRIRRVSDVNPKPKVKGFVDRIAQYRRLN